MHSAGLYAANRDGEALAALIASADKRFWNPYVLDEQQGKILLAEAAFSDRDAITRVVMAETIWFPDHTTLTTTAWLARRHATELEKAGRIDEGFQIRRALVSVGRLVRMQAKNVNHV